MLGWGGAKRLGVVLISRAPFDVLADGAKRSLCGLFQSAGGSSRLESVIGVPCATRESQADRPTLRTAMQSAHQQDSAIGLDLQASVALSARRQIEREAPVRTQLRAFEARLSRRQERSAHADRIEANRHPLRVAQAAFQSVAPRRINRGTAQ